MQNKMGLLSMIAVGISSIIGSGWLFSSYYVAKTTLGGFMPYLAWIVAACIALTMALIISEIVTIYPKRGLFTRLLTIAYNNDLGYITAIAEWIAMVAVIPTEAEATVQYLSTVNPHWAVYLFSHDKLTSMGLLCVVFILGVYTFLNFWGVRLLSKSNNLLTIFKVVLPILIAIVILYVSFHPSNFYSTSPLVHRTITTDFSSVLTAVMTGGIVYAFNGFQSICVFCTEIENPEKNVPRAMVLAILICLGIYLLLQTAFIGGIPPSHLYHGWSALNFHSPIAQLCMLLGLHALAITLYIDACISPSGTGIVYLGSTSRILTAMSQESQAPAIFNRISKKYNFSRYSLVFNLFLCLIFLFLFKSWQGLVTVISGLHLIAYMACPLSLMRLRITQGELPRLFKVPFASLICPVIFVLITIFYSSMETLRLAIVTLLVALFYCAYIIIHNQWDYNRVFLAFKRSYMFCGYLVWLAILQFFYAYFHTISQEMFYFCVTVSSILFYYYLVYLYRDVDFINCDSQTIKHDEA